MSTSYDGPDVHLMVGAYTLDALDPEHTAQFEVHMQRCPTCRREVLSLRAAAAELGAAQTAAAPSRLRAEVLAAVSRTPQLPPTTVDLTLPDAALSPAATDDIPPDGSGAGTLLELRPRRITANRALAVAAGLLLVIGGALGWRSATLSNNLDQMQANVSAVTSVLTAPDAVTVTGPLSVGGRGAVVTSASVGQAAIVTDGVPAPPLGKVYQLWFMSASGSATPAGFLTPDASGQGAQVLTGTIGAATLVGVTVEPSGGSPAPTTTPVLALKI